MLNAISQHLQSVPMMSNQPIYEPNPDDSQLDIESSIQREKKWEMQMDQLAKWLNNMSRFLQDRQRQGQLEGKRDLHKKN